MALIRESLFQEINGRITGRLALLSPGEAELLYDVIASTPGNHAEIGCLWGGTAILAALAKAESGQAGHIYTIDPMAGGFWDYGDPVVQTVKPSPVTVLDNLVRFGVADRVSVVKAKSSPWPLRRELEIATILVDGDHSFEGCLLDWQTVSVIKPRYAVFHDYDASHPGVARVVDDYVSRAHGWKEAVREGSLVVWRCQQ